VSPQAADPAEVLGAESNKVDWPQRVLRQTIFVSSMATEILRDTHRADWDESFYKETSRLGNISENRGAEEIPVLVD
jgi:hypothetical protein